MLKIINILVVIGILNVFVPADASQLERPGAFESASTQFIGTRILKVDDKELSIPWYKFEADYEAIERGDIWDNIVVPNETKSTYIGRYGILHWCDWDNGVHSSMAAIGLAFTLPGEKHVPPGEGNVDMRWWLYEEQEPNTTMSFQNSRYYVFCLDRQPVTKWINLAEKPFGDMDGELDHIVGIIEIQPTFDFNKWRSTAAFYLTQENLISFRNENYAGSYELSFLIERKDNDLFECLTPQGRTVAKPETLEMLLYAMNSRIWKQQKDPHNFEDPAGGRVLIEYLDPEGKRQKAFIEYDKGTWFLTLPENKYYRAFYPDLMAEVFQNIEKSCAHKE